MKRYGEKTLREALENGAIIRKIDDPMRGPIWRVMIDGEISGYIVMDLFTKLNHDGTIKKSGYGYMYQDFSAKKVVFGEKTTETETTETTNDRKQYIATFMDGLDGAIRVEFLEATDEKHARYKVQHMAGMFETVENVREVDPDDLEKISGVTVPRFVDVMTHDEISGTIDALKKAVAPLEAEMEADNIPKEKWLELDKEVTQTWEKIGVLQYLQIVQGTGVDPSGRKFRDVEMGEIR